MPQINKPKVCPVHCKPHIDKGIAEAGPVCWSCANDYHSVQSGNIPPWRSARNPKLAKRDVLMQARSEIRA